MTDPIARVGDRRDWGAFFWKWCRFVFNGWALLAALLFLVLGFVAGYEMSQPDRYSEPTRLMLQRLDELEDLLVKVRGASLPNVHAEQEELDRAIDATRSAITALPAAQKNRLAPHLDQIVTHGEAVDEALHDQSVAFDGAITEHLRAIRSAREMTEQQIEAVDGMGPWLFDQSKRFLKWIGALSFLTILAVALFFLLMNNPGLRRIVARSSGSISVFGLSFNLSDVQSVRDSIETRQRALGDDLVRAYTSALRASAVETMFKRVYDELCKSFAKEGIDLTAIPHRATLYVPDFVGEYLVQATRYYGNWRQGNETVVGRRFSVRYGIIGKAWRLINPQYNSNVRNENKNLIRNWGFTSAEAWPFSSNPAAASLMAFVLKDAGSLPPLALIYIEADGANRLHNKSKLSDAEAEAQQPDADGLTLADHFAAKHIWEGVADMDGVKRLKTMLVRLQSVLRWNDKVEGGPGR